MMETKVDVYIPLTQGKVAVIDFEDFEKVRGWSFRLHKGRGQVTYAHGVRTENGKQVHRLLHRILWGALPRGLELGHRDGDGLNCRRSNLQAVTHAQNLQGKCNKKKNSTSRFRGVHWKTGKLKWWAQIRAGGKVLYLGLFDKEEDAARAYDTAATKYFGEFAALNFPDQKQCQSSVNAGVSP